MQPVAGSTQSGLSVGALAYDAIAPGYDAQVEGDAWMRSALHGSYARVFHRGDRVLDVGCGTGIDAVFLAGLGARVTAIDFSPAMIARCQARVASAGLEARVEARVLSIERLDSLRGVPFDGLVSAFASLSTLPDLGQFARDAATLVRPGGHLVLHLLNRFSVWEWLGYLRHANWAAARQVGHVRERDFSVGGRAVRHTLYFPGEAYRRFFAADFALRAAYGPGWLRPPHTVRRLPAGVGRALGRVDVRFSGWPLLQNAGRFFVLDLERLPM